MNKEDYKKLEELLLKLKIELGGRYCIIPEAVQNSYHIGLYADNGDIKHRATTYDIEDAVKRIKRCQT